MIHTSLKLEFPTHPAPKVPNKQLWAQLHLSEHSLGSWGRRKQKIDPAFSILIKDTSLNGFF
jgi:hypothetical protein